MRFNSVKNAPVPPPMRMPGAAVRAAAIVAASASHKERPTIVLAGQQRRQRVHAFARRVCCAAPDVDPQRAWRSRDPCGGAGEPIGVRGVDLDRRETEPQSLQASAWPGRSGPGGRLVPSIGAVAVFSTKGAALLAAERVGAAEANFEPHLLLDNCGGSNPVGKRQAQRTTIGLVRGVGPVPLVFDLENLALENQPQAIACGGRIFEASDVEERLVWRHKIRKLCLLDASIGMLHPHRAAARRWKRVEHDETGAVCVKPGLRRSPRVGLNKTVGDRPCGGPGQVAIAIVHEPTGAHDDASIFARDDRFRRQGQGAPVGVADNEAEAAEQFLAADGYLADEGAVAVQSKRQRAYAKRLER